ncbi:uncharacterized protein METZ01_LOCUS414059 [marine metagenome]|uniref:Uncharacterized protein n=1 Tax=marine metagenome TaxID=408172 RepID=A0A382WS25_9ZZZZ
MIFKLFCARTGASTTIEKKFNLDLYL